MNSDPSRPDLGLSAGSRGGLAAAWVALQLVRVIFLPFIVIGLGMRFAEDRSRKQAGGQLYTKPASPGTTDI